MVSVIRISTKLLRYSSYKPPGASYTAQGPQKQPDIFKNQLFISSTTNKHFDFWTWTSVSRPFKPVPGRKFHVDFETAIQNTLNSFNQRRNFRKNENYESSNAHPFIFPYILLNGTIYGL